MGNALEVDPRSELRVRNLGPLGEQEEDKILFDKGMLKKDWKTADPGKLKEVLSKRNPDGIEARVLSAKERAGKLQKLLASLGIDMPQDTRLVQPPKEMNIEVEE